MEKRVVFYLSSLLFNVARPEHRKSEELREKSKFQTNRLRFKISQAIHVQRTENRSCVKIQFWKTEIIPSALCFITFMYKESCVFVCEDFPKENQKLANEQPTLV